MKSCRFYSLFLAALAALHAQAPASPAKFDAASIKLHPGIVNISYDPSVRGRRVVSTASTLRDLILYAYGLGYDIQIAGLPKWALSDHYDLNAEAEGEGVLTTAQARQMMQNLLADRFQLQVHRETEEVPMYALVIAKGGPKLKESAPDATGGASVIVGEKGIHLEAKRYTMDQFARQLSITAGRPVVDKTGLTAYYAFTMDWFPANRPSVSDVDTPDMFAALQELGLKLEPIKGPMQELVIDRVEKPSEN